MPRAEPSRTCDWYFPIRLRPLEVIQNQSEEPSHPDGEQSRELLCKPIEFIASVDGHAVPWLRTAVRSCNCFPAGVVRVCLIAKLSRVGSPNIEYMLVQQVLATMFRLSTTQSLRCAAERPHVEPLLQSAPGRSWQGSRLISSAGLEASMANLPAALHSLRCVRCVSPSRTHRIEEPY